MDQPSPTPPRPTPPNPRPAPPSAPIPLEPLAPGDFAARPAPSQASPRVPRVQADQARLAAARTDLKDRISAYPGDLTYLDLIRRNKRESALLVVLMIALAVLLGAVIGAVVGPYASGMGHAGRSFGRLYDIPVSSGPQDIDRLFEHQERARRDFERVPQQVLGADTRLARDLSVVAPSAFTGAAIAAVLSSLAAVWSWFGGASAILAMTGAREIAHADDPELFNVVDEVRIAGGLPMPRVYLIPETAMNAFATGRDPEHAAVAITTALREKLTRDELQGVMAHEVAHIRHYDIRFAMLMATMVGLIVFACDAFWRIGVRLASQGPRHPRDDRDRGKGGGGGGLPFAAILFVVALVLAILAPVFARLIQMAYSRRREYLADAGAVELTRQAEPLAAALLKLADDPEPLIERANRGTAHLFIMNPLDTMRRTRQQLDSMFSSHPPVQERVARLLALTR